MHPGEWPLRQCHSEASHRQTIARSAEPIKSLRTVERATNSHKGYNVMGSDLIILPQSDFSPGSYIMELKFEKSSVVLLADMHIVENPVVSGN